MFMVGMNNNEKFDFREEYSQIRKIIQFYQFIKQEKK